MHTQANMQNYKHPQLSATSTCVCVLSPHHLALKLTKLKIKGCCIRMQHVPLTVRMCEIATVVESAVCSAEALSR